MAREAHGKKKKGFVLYTGEYIALNNATITDMPTLRDWLPWGLTIEKTPDNQLRNVPPFTENNFCFYASGTSEDGKHTISSSGCFAPQGGKVWKISIDGKWYMVKGTPPVRYDDGTQYGYPTVYTDPDGPFLVALSFNEPEQKWVFQCYNKEGTFSCRAELTGEGVPFWAGKPEGPYTMMSIWSPKQRDIFEVWGAFVEMCTYTATVKTPEFGEIRVRGLGWSDREYHKRVPGYELKSKPRPKSAPINYWAISIMQDDADIGVFYCTEPWTGEVRAEAGRVYFPKTGIHCAMEEYTLTDNGGVNPTEFRIKGKHERGTVDVVGTMRERVGFNSKEFLEKGEWGPTPTKCLADGMQVAFWQVFVDWDGEVTIDGESVKVRAKRNPSEITKMQEPPADMEPPQAEGSEVEWVYE